MDTLKEILLMLFTLMRKNPKVDKIVYGISDGMLAHDEQIIINNTTDSIVAEVHIYEPFEHKIYPFTIEEATWNKFIHELFNKYHFLWWSRERFSDVGDNWTYDDMSYYVDITFSNGYIVHHTGCFQSKGNQLLRDLFVEHFGLWHHRCYEDK